MKAIETKSYVLNQNNIRDIVKSLNNFSLDFYRFYNMDLTPGMNAFINYLNKYKHLDDKFWDKKILNKTYYDIETFFDPKKAPDAKKAEFKINSISFYNNIDNILFFYFLKDKSHHFDENTFLIEVKKIYDEKVKENPIYKVDDIQFQVKLFNNEKDLLISFFRKLIELQTFYLIGFNSKLFDDLYTINRLFQLVGKDEALRIITDFDIRFFGDYSIEQPEYVRADILDLYKPVDAGGQGYGQSLPNYKLNTIAEVELGITKLDLDGDFNYIYYNKPFQFAMYNGFDVILTFKIDEKLQILEQLYSLAKTNATSIPAAITGRSFLFNYRNSFYYYTHENQLIRFNKFNKEVLRPI
jgi:DNA polymerase elongation subunit (family B)